MTQPVSVRIAARWTAALALGLALTATGCKSRQPAPVATQTQPAPTGQPAPAPQSQVPLSDGSMPNAQQQPNQSATAPNGQQPTSQSSTMAPNASGPMAVPPAAVPAPPPPSAPAGTAVSFRTNQTISSTQNQIGEHFGGTLAHAIVSHGQTVFPSGTPVTGDIVALNRKGRFKGAGDLGIVLTEIGGHRVETSEYEKVVKGRGGRTAGLVAGGAGLGAIIGGLAGHGRGAIIGGLSGAGAGTAVSATGNRSVSLPAESLVTVRLSTALTR